MVEIINLFDCSALQVQFKLETHGGNFIVIIGSLPVTQVYLRIISRIFAIARLGLLKKRYMNFYGIILKVRQLAANNDCEL